MDIEELKKDLLERITDENLYFGEFLYTIKKEQESEICQYIKGLSEKYGVEIEARLSLLWFCSMDDEHLWVSVKGKGA